MKQTVCALVAIAALTFQCSVAKKKAASACVQGKIVRISCASYIVQSLNVDTLGQDGWKNTADTAVTFDNVFDVSNKCKLPDGLKAGDTIYFNVQAPQASDCISCMMYDAPPTVKYDLKYVSRNPCE
jgi:hypothetical protein